MKNDPGNRDLAEAFEALKSEDARNAPPFGIPGLGSELQSGWRAGPGLIAVGFAAAAVIGLFLVANGPEAEIPAGEPIAFDYLNEVISRELFGASVSQWKSPTGFLLNVESFPSNSESLEK